MADARTYIRVHDGMDEHPKIEGLSDAAFRLLMSCWFYCSRNLTDGRITDAAWQKRGNARTRRELTSTIAGYGALVEQCDGYVQMHDYLEHQRSADEVADLRRRRAAAGSRGGKAKAKALASAIASASSLAKQVPKQMPSKNVAVSVTDTSLRSVAAQQRGHRIPDDFQPDDDLRKWAMDRGFTDPQIDEVTTVFVRYWQAKPGRAATKLNWPLTWQNWVAKEDPRRVQTPTEEPPKNRHLTGDELTAILGPDTWTCPTPPPGLDPDAEWEWRRQRQLEHITERQQQARDKTGRAS